MPNPIEDYLELSRETSEIYHSVSVRRDEIEANERASTIFHSVEEMYTMYDDSSALDDPAGAIATLRHVHWGLRTVAAMIDDEPLPTLLDMPEPDRWGYLTTLIVAASFGLLVALLLWELIT